MTENKMAITSAMMIMPIARLLFLPFLLPRLPDDGSSSFPKPVPLPVPSYFVRRMIIRVKSMLILLIPSGIIMVMNIRLLIHTDFLRCCFPYMTRIQY